MGLDMYAYTAAKADTDSVSQRELAYWRKHPNLHGWMEKLWEFRVPIKHRTRSDGRSQSFNGVEVELTWEDLDRLEQAINTNDLPKTSGFFFGNDSDSQYQEQDLNFIKKAKAELFLGLKVFYNSSW